MKNRNTFILLVVLSIYIAGCAAPAKKSGRINLIKSDRGFSHRKHNDKKPLSHFKKPVSAAKSKIPGQKIVVAKQSATERKPANIAPAMDIQTALKNAGYNVGKIDGKIGPKTEAAIKMFQKDNRLTSDGVVGRRTWAILSKYLSVSAGLSNAGPLANESLTSSAPPRVEIVSASGETPAELTMPSAEHIPPIDLATNTPAPPVRSFTPLAGIVIIILIVIFAVLIYARRNK